MEQVGPYKLYSVVARKLPTQKEDKNAGKLFRMNVFAKSDVAAKSKFWNNMNKIVKVKKSTGEIVSIKEVHEKNMKSVKNVGIWLRYDSRSKTHNMYREYRDMTVVGAVNRCYMDMAGKHRARSDTMQILKACVIPASKCKKANVKQFHKPNISFPLIHRIGSVHKRVNFTRNRPSTFI